MERMQLAEVHGRNAGRVYGVKGQCQLTKQLWYTSYNNLFTIPTYHLLLHGVLRSFWSHALSDRSVISGADRKIMESRSDGVITTSDFNSRYSDITKNHTNWKMYDWLTWADVWSNFVLLGITIHGDMPPTRSLGRPGASVYVCRTFTELVMRMHGAVVFFVRAQDEDS